MEAIASKLEAIAIRLDGALTIHQVRRSAPGEKATAKSLLLLHEILYTKAMDNRGPGKGGYGIGPPYCRQTNFKGEAKVSATVKSRSKTSKKATLSFSALICDFSAH